MTPARQRTGEQIQQHAIRRRNMLLFIVAIGLIFFLFVLLANFSGRS